MFKVCSKIGISVAGIRNAPNRLWRFVQSNKQITRISATTAYYHLEIFGQKDIVNSSLNLFSNIFIKSDSNIEYTFYCLRL